MEGWYWKIVVLTFGMTFIVTFDVLYDFPAAPLTDGNSFGTGYVLRDFRLNYSIIFGLVGCILFVYTAIGLTLNRPRWKCRCQRIFGSYAETATKTLGYMVVCFLLTGAMLFNWLLLYSSSPGNALSKAYYAAVSSINPPVDRPCGAWEEKLMIKYVRFDKVGGGQGDRG